MTDIHSPEAQLLHFVPRIAQCSIVAGLKIGWISGLSAEYPQPQNVVDLFAGQDLSFTFTALAATESIDVQFGTYCRRNRGALDTQILDANGLVISRNELKLSAIEDNEYTLLHDVRGVPLVPGENYTIKLTSSGDDSQRLAVWGNICSPIDAAVPILVAAIIDRSFAPRPRRRSDLPARIGIVSPQSDSNDPCQDLSCPLGASKLAATVGYKRLLLDWPSLSEADVIFFRQYDQLSNGWRLDEICYAMHRLGIVTIAMVEGSIIPKWCRTCHYTLTLSPLSSSLSDNIDRKLVSTFETLDIAKILGEHQERRQPSVAILCRAADQSRIADTIRDVLDAEEGGPKLQFICVASAQDEPREDRHGGRIVHSWSEAISIADQRVVLLVGRGVAITSEFVKAHIFEHWYNDVEFVSSRLRVEGREITGRESAPIHGEECFCDLRALSLKGQLARHDVTAAISESHNDVGQANEILNVRLKARGAVIRASEQSASLVELQPSIDGKTGTRSITRGGASRRLRVLSYRWHAPHQYELFRLPLDFTLAKGFGNHITELWPYSERPLRENVRFQLRSEIDPRDYDVCLVHFDENVLCPELSNGVLPNNWGEPFSWLLSLGNLPIIAICHGTPPFSGQYARDNARKTKFEVLEDQRIKLVSTLSAGGAFVVCNSHQARAEWGFENCRVIWHGFDPYEFRRGSHSRGVLTLSHDKTRPHYRGLFEQIEVEMRLAPDIEVVRGGHDQIPLEIRTTNSFACRQFRSYVDHIGQFKVYLNTTLRSPMPRTRSEAMMTGVIPVSLANHDVELFIENGIDGFYAHRPEELASFINELIRDERALARMGAAARQKAIDVFNCQRFQNDWWRLLEDALGRDIPRPRPRRVGRQSWLTRMLRVRRLGGFGP